MRQFKQEVKKMKSEVMEMIQANNIVSHNPSAAQNMDKDLEKYDAQLAYEIENIELHFKNLIKILGEKKDKMIQGLRASMGNEGNQGILFYLLSCFNILMCRKQ